MDGGEAGRDVFRVLFVCTGNIHRSPTAEILTRHLLKGRLGGRDAARFAISSAGVHAVVGAPMHPMSRARLAPWGLDGAHSAEFRARQVGPDVVRDADLVLGASPHHRASVLEEHPELLDRTFSLREFARLAAQVPQDALPQHLVPCARALVTESRALRGRVPAPDDDRIPDPVGGPVEAHELATTLIFDAVKTILDVLAPRPGTRPPSALRRPRPPITQQSRTRRLLNSVAGWRSGRVVTVAWSPAPSADGEPREAPRAAGRGGAGARSTP